MATTYGGPWFGLSPQPLIVNPLPPRFLWNWPPEIPYVFGLRDRETSIDLSKVNVVQSQGKAFFPWPLDDPTFTDPGTVFPPITGGSVDLPEVLARLNDPQAAYGAMFGDFSDTGVLGPSGSVPSGETSRVADRGSLEVQKTSGVFPGAPTHQSGVYYLYDSAEESFSAHASARLVPGLPFQANYTTFADYLGYTVGLIHGPSKKAVLCFVCGTYALGWTQLIVRVCSPATDGLGTRVVHSTMTWAIPGLPAAIQPDLTFRINWDGPGNLVTVVVNYENAFLVPGSTTFDQGVAEVPIAALGTMLPQSVVGDWDFNGDVGPSTLVACMDTAYQNSFATWSSLGFQNTLYPVVTSGNQGLGARASIYTANMVSTDAGALAQRSFNWEVWNRVWVSSSLATGDTGEGTDDSARLTEGQDLFRQDVIRVGAPGWEIVVDFQGVAFSHPGTINTGFGFALRNEDDDYYVEIFLFYDYASRYLAVLTPSNPAAPSYTTESEFTKVLLDWQSRNIVRISFDAAWSTLDFSTEDGELIASVPTADLPSLSALPVDPTNSTYQLGQDFGSHYMLGQLKDEGDIILSATPVFTGTLDFWYFRVFGDTRVFEARRGKAPHQAPNVGTEQALGTGGWSIVGNELIIEDTDFGAETGPPQGYQYWVIPHPKLAPSTGGVWSGYLKVDSWTGTLGTSDPVDEPIYAGPAIDDGSDSVVVVFVKAVTGKHYAYIPGSNLATSLTNVLAQNAAGQAISTEVDFTAAHSYMLVYSPREAIRLYIDGAEDPSIEIEWGASGFDVPSLTLGAGAILGSYNPYRAVTLRSRNVRLTSREAFDLAVARRWTEEELPDRNSALSPLTIVVEDKD